MLQALNTGHDGSLSTVHANSPTDALARLETLVLLAGVALPLAAVRAQLAAAIDAVVQVARGRERRAAVVEVAEVGGRRRGSARSRRASLLDARRRTASWPVDAPDARRAGEPASISRRRGAGAHARRRADRRPRATVVLVARRRAGTRSTDRLRADVARGALAAACRARAARSRARPTRRSTSTPEQRGRGVAARRGASRRSSASGSRRSPACSAAVGSAASARPSRCASRRQRRARIVAAAVPGLARAGRCRAARRRNGRRPRSRRIARGDGPLAPDLARLETRVRLGASLLRCARRRGRASGRRWASRRPPARSRSAATVGGRAADALDGARLVVARSLAVAAEARALSAQAGTRRG